jgi:hypothetical protein
LHHLQHDLDSRVPQALNRHTLVCHETSAPPGDDGSPPRRLEGFNDATIRRKFLRKIGYKL